MTVEHSDEACEPDDLAEVIEGAFLTPYSTEDPAVIAEAVRSYASAIFDFLYAKHAHPPSAQIVVAECRAALLGPRP